MLCFRPTSIFAQADVADPVEAILDAPVATIEAEQFGGRSPLGGEAGDGVGDVRRHASLLFDDAFDAADLLEARPIEEFRQPRTGLQMPLRNAAMSFVDRVMLGQLLLALAFATGGKIPAEIRLRSPPSARVGCLSR